MRRFMKASAGGALVVALSAGCDRGLGPDEVASAGAFVLTVEDAARLLAPVSSLPNELDVAESTIDFWTDYTLLALAVNGEGVLDELDTGPLLELERARQTVLRLREEMIQVDTSITEEELGELFEEERPREEVRARHILLSVAPATTQGREDSLRALAEDLRDRARAGEDFAQLAEQFSEDPGSAVRGGDLGFFGRGAMVAPFEEAAFALEPGEVSDVVRSEFGFHVIRLEERRRPSFEEMADLYRAQVQARRMMVAESIYLEEVEGPAEVRVVDGAIELSRQIAEDPEENLSGREASVPLTSYATGEFTAGEYREFLFSQPAEIWQQIALAGDDEIDRMLRELTRDRVLLAEAESVGIVLTEEEDADIASELVEQYVLIADFLGIDSLRVESGETMADVVEREVASLMERLVTSEQDIIPLGAMARPLRRRFGNRVAEGAAERIVARVSELRSGAQ